MAVEPRPRGLWLRRIGWLIAIWAASIAALAVDALIAPPRRRALQP